MNIFYWYFSKRALPYWAIFILDCIIALFSFAIVQLSIGGVSSILAGPSTPKLVTYAICLLCYIIGFRTFRTYSGVIRYSSFVDLQRIAFAVARSYMHILYQYFYTPHSYTGSDNTVFDSCGALHVDGTCHCKISLRHHRH